MADEISVPAGGLIVSTAGERLVLEPGTTTVVGRSSQCDIQLSNEHISRRHLELTSDDGVWRGRDLDTANGTFVEGEVATTFEITELTVVVLGGGRGEVLTLEPEPALEDDEAASPTAAPTDPDEEDTLTVGEVPAVGESLADMQLPPEPAKEEASLPPLDPLDLPSLPDDEPPGPEPGWYPNPDDATQARYWDGIQWSQEQKPTRSPDAEPAAEHRPLPALAERVDLPAPDAPGEHVLDDEAPPPELSGRVDLPPPDGVADDSAPTDVQNDDSAESAADFGDDPPPIASMRVDSVPPPPGFEAPPPDPIPEPAPPPLPPANWYPDPDGSARQRYWDGSAWTEHYHPPG